ECANVRRPEQSRADGRHAGQPIGGSQADRPVSDGAENGPRGVRDPARSTTELAIALSTRKTQRGCAGRPGAVPTAGVADLGGDGDLGQSRGIAGKSGSTVRPPGAERELESAVVAVPRVRGPVATGLAL